MLEARSWRIWDSEQERVPSVLVQQCVGFRALHSAGEIEVQEQTEACFLKRSIF